MTPFITERRTTLFPTLLLRVRLARLEARRRRADRRVRGCLRRTRRCPGVGSTDARSRRRRRRGRRRGNEYRCRARRSFCCYVRRVANVPGERSVERPPPSPRSRFRKHFLSVFTRSRFLGTDEGRTTSAFEKPRRRPRRAHPGARRGGGAALTREPWEGSGAHTGR